MVYYNALYNWVGFHPLYNPTNQGFFHCSSEIWKKHVPQNMHLDRFKSVGSVLFPKGAKKKVHGWWFGA